MSENGIAASLKTIRENIKLAYEKRSASTEDTQVSREPCLVAVSKTKPNEMIEQAYQENQRDFGENYVQELVEKSKFFKEAGGFDDIRWHFIGHLQRNKVNNLLGAENLYVIETVDNVKLADAINKRWAGKNEERKLKVYTQVNTSGEDNKSGVAPSECTQLVEHIVKNCPALELEGLMTIGSFDHDYSSGPNPDFIKLVQCRDQVSKDLDLSTDKLQLSMGMSGDYEHAILAGSTTVRVGSSIFGAR